MGETSGECMESDSEQVVMSPTYYLFSVCAVLIECLLLSTLMRLIPYYLLGTYPTFFNLFSLIHAFSDQISKTDIY